MVVARRTLKLSSAGRAGAAACALALLVVACAATPPARSVAPPAAITDGASADTVDASYDWHGLLIAPFGTLLKDVPAALHEVLLFQDEQRTAAVEDGKDCYAIDSQPPRFLGAVPTVYLLCFTHDHLTRIEATVPLRVDAAAREFARACASWQKRAGAPSALPAIPAAPAGSAAPAATCEGHDAGLAYGAQLHAESDQADMPVSITLVSGADSAPPVRAR